MTDRSQSRETVSRLLAALGDRARDTEELMALVYNELHRLAEQLMRSERAHHTLQPTALVHEAFLRLVGDASVENARESFLAVAAVVMRRVLVDHARRNRAERRGGDWCRVTLAGLANRDASDDIDVLELNDALDELTELDARQAKVVELRFFAGMSGQEIADHLGVSRNTVVRELTMARAWLRKRIRMDD